MLKNYSLLIGLSLGLVLSSAQAALDLELTQGVSQMFPIAMLSAEPLGSTKEKSLTEVVRHDLQNSGQIRVTTFEKVSSLPDPLKEATRWRNKKVNAVAYIRVQPLMRSRYAVTVTLTNPFAEGTPLSAKNFLLERSFTVDAEGQRGLAHHISDLIYEKLTGIRGIFSTKIAYILIQSLSDNRRQYQLQVADADGFNPQSLLVSSEPIMSLAWAPDGKRIAYVSFEGKRAAIYVQEIHTGKRERVSALQGINGAPAFSPDGRSLALVLTQPDNPKIYVLNLDSKTLRRITDGSSIDTEPVWSPDGQFLFFTSDRGGSPQIYKCSTKPGSIATRVTYRGDYNAHPSFVADGHSIVFMHREYGSFGIASQDLETGNMHLLVQSDADESPSVAPNGEMVIYATEYARRGILAQVSVDGRVRIRLPAPEGTVREPAWSPYLGMPKGTSIY